MNDDNHADTANTLVSATDPQLSSDSTPTPNDNPISVSDSGGNTIILTGDNDQLVNKPYTSDASNYSPDSIQK